MTIEHRDDPWWFVQISADEVRALSLDALDEAFQAGEIDEATLVREDGSAQSPWTTLGAMLGDAHVKPVVAAEPAPTSVAPPPVVAELDVAHDLPSFGGSQKRGALLAAIAILIVLGAAGVTAARMASSGALPNGDASKVTASFGAAKSETVGSISPSSPELAADAGTRFSDDQRRLLLEADKKREAEAAARRPVRSGSNAPSRPIKIGDPISKGGSKYDPLNGQL